MRSTSVAAGLVAAGLVALGAGALPQHQQAFSLPPAIEQISFSSPSSHGHANFTGHQVVRFSTATKHQHHDLLAQAHKLGLDVWAAHRSHACSRDHDEQPFGCIDIHLAPNTHDENPLRPSAACSHDSCSVDAIEQLMQPLKHKPNATVMIHNLEAAILSHKRFFINTEHERERQVELIKTNAWHNEYHTYDEINAYMHMLEQAYPGHASVVELGKTHEGRSILGLKISQHLAAPQPPPTHPQPEPQPDPPSNATFPTSTGKRKLGIVITGSQHAREWISTSSSLFFGSELLRTALGNPTAPSNATLTSFDLDHDDDDDDDDDDDTLRRGNKGRKGRKKRPAKPWTKKQAQHLLSTFEITVVPVSNPDGYVYSWDHNRMWRKNRQPNQFPGGLFCKGVDVNRNFGFAFANSLLSACSEMYAGAAAFSTAESRAIGGYLQDPENNVHAFFDLHSYGQLMMYPFSYSCDVPVADEEDLLEVSLGAISALKQVHGRQYNAGKICQVYAQGGGNAVDWAYASTDPVPDHPNGPAFKRNIKWSFAVELRDGGTYGFLLPKQQIVPASQEVAAALAYMLSFVAKKNGR